MPTIRVMPGVIDMQGQKVNTLDVGQMVSRHPRPRYETTCERCGTRSTESQDRLVSGAARCRAEHCGKPERPRGRELLDERIRIAAENDAKRLAEAREISELKMELDTDDWELPTKTRPDPQPYLPKSERERLERRERLEAEEAERRAEEAPRLRAERLAAEEREAAESSQRERAEKQRNYWAEWVQSDPDPNLFVTPALATAEMPAKAAEAFTTKAAAQFASEPEYTSYRTMKNADVIINYLRRNGVFIADVETIRAAFRRLRDLGLLKQRSAPQPQPVEQPRRVNLTIAPAQSPQKKQPFVYDGWDEDGNPRQYSEREVSRWSADEMKRRLRLTEASGALKLPNIGPGPSGYTR